MSKEKYFRIVSNLKNSTELVPSNLTVKNADDIIKGDNTFQLIKAHDEWLLCFETPHYQDEIADLVRRFKKPINTYDDLGDFQKFCYEQKSPFDSIPKIYFIENNGSEEE